MNEIFSLSFFHFLSAALQARLRERVVSFYQGSDITEQSNRVQYLSTNTVK